MTRPANRWLIILISIYAADLHKLTMSILGFAGAELLDTRLVDTIFAGTLTAALAFTVLQRGIPRIVFSPAALCALALWVLMTLSLTGNSDPTSVEQYLRFSFGNVLLFFGTLVLCRSIEGVAIAYRVWLVNSVLLAAIAIYLFLIGVTWSSGRNELFSFTSGIRTGYFCGASIIILVCDFIFREGQRMRSRARAGLLLAVCAAGLVLSGSKGAAVVALVMIGGAVLLKLAIERKISFGYVGLISLVMASTVLVLLSAIDTLAQEGGATGYLGQLQSADSYLRSAQSRVELSVDYVETGVNAPFFGQGISAAYDLYTRTHSIFTSLFVQVGLVGLGAHLFFLWALAVAAVKALRATSIARQSRAVLVAAIICAGYLVIKGEVTGDLAGNRELWFFSALLLVCSSQVRKSASIAAQGSTRQFLANR